jgi:hypothetical protein
MAPHHVVYFLTCKKKNQVNSKHTHTYIICCYNSIQHSFTNNYLHNSIAISVMGCVADAGVMCSIVVSCSLSTDITSSLPTRCPQCFLLGETGCSVVPNSSTESINFDLTIFWVTYGAQGTQLNYIQSIHIGKQSYYTYTAGNLLIKLI